MYTPKCLLLGNDGDLIVVGTDIGCVQLFSLSQKKLLSTLDWDQAEPLSSLSLDENDHYLAAGSIHGTVVIFDLQSKTKVKKTTNKLHKDPIVGLSFLNNANYMLIVSKDASLLVRSLETCKIEEFIDSTHESEPKLFFSTFSAYLSSFAISQDKAYFATGSEADECNIKIWRVSGLEPVREIENAHEDTLWSLLINHDNTKLFSSALDSVIKCWSVSDGLCLYKFLSKQDGGCKIALTPSEEYMITGGEDASLRFWHLTQENQPCVYVVDQSHVEPITAITVTQNSRYLITGSDDCSIKVWDLKEKNWEHTFAKPHKKSILRASFTANDNAGILTFGEDNYFKHWNFHQPQFPVTKGRNEALVKALTQSPDRKYVISGTVSGNLKFWTKNGKIDHTINLCHLGICNIWFTDNNKKFITTCSEVVKLWDYETKTLVDTFKDSKLQNLEISCISQNQMLYFSPSSKAVIYYSLLEKKIIDKIDNPHKSSITAICLNNNEDQLATGSTDKSIKVWDIKTKTCLAAFEKAHKERISSLLIWSSRNMIISGSDDRTVKIWSLKDKSLQNTFSTTRAKDGGVSVLLISPDEKYLFVGSADGSARVYQLSE